ncbi:MAG: hypothetical protein B7X99_20770 [Rhizobiales bacterium 17-65-6]|nr:MAG: hypothetical protein B7X99_20770 [Rhizobiales bacterium 17-65-6]
MSASDPRAAARLRARAAREAMSPEEDAAITAAAAADPDNPPLTDADFARMAPAPRRGRGPGKAPVKAQVTLRLDPDVLERFRAEGPGWQARINAALRKAAGL